MPKPPGVEPFSLGPSDGPRVALFHGLTGTPAEVWPLGVALAAAGYHADAPRWEGHGMSPQDLARVSADDLIAHARRIAREDAPEVVLGISMGALLAIIAAAELPAVRALVLLAPAIHLQGPNGFFQRLGRWKALRHTHALVPKPNAGLPAAAPILPPDDLAPRLRRAASAAAEAAPVAQERRYDHLPLRWAYELRVIREEAQRVAPRVHAPALVLHGALDRTSSLESSLEAARWLGGECRFRVFPQSPHVMPLGPERGLIAAEIVAFLDRYCSSSVTSSSSLPAG